MNLYELIKKNGAGKGEESMWSAICIISDYVDSYMDDESKDSLMRQIYGVMSSGHYNEDYAKEDVAKMYYVGNDGMKHYAPYWSEQQVKQVYESVKRSIPADYNMWDFYVALQMSKADNCPLLRKWFPDASDSDMETKVVEMAVNYLNDEDSPAGHEKVWQYLNSRK